MYYKLFILLWTALPGETELTHTHTVETSHVYYSEQSCLKAAGAIGFRVHPLLREAGVNFKCLEVGKSSLENKIPHIDMNMELR